MPSVFWRCWLGGRKGIQLVKNWVVGCWRGYLSGASCRLAQLMPLPLTVSSFSKIQFGFTFLVPTHPGSPGQRAIKRVCVCVCLCKWWKAFIIQLWNNSFPTKMSKYQRQWLFVTQHQCLTYCEFFHRRKILVEKNPGTVELLHFFTGK